MVLRQSTAQLAHLLGVKEQKSPEVAFPRPVCTAPRSNIVQAVVVGDEEETKRNAPLEWSYAPQELKDRAGAPATYELCCSFRVVPGCVSSASVPSSTLRNAWHGTAGHDLILASRWGAAKDLWLPDGTAKSTPPKLPLLRSDPVTVATFPSAQKRNGVSATETAVPTPWMDALWGLLPRGHIQLERATLDVLLLFIHAPSTNSAWKLGKSARHCGRQA